MSTRCRLLLGLWLALIAAAQGVAPPQRGRSLTAEEEKEVDRLERQLYRFVESERFEEAARMARQVADYRAQRQGTGHWEVSDARQEVERWQRLTPVPAKDRVEVVRALRAATEGKGLQRRLRYREAEAKLRAALARRRKVLGEEHSETARSYNSVAFCLHRQGKYAEALPLLHKALAINRKTLGERHRDTAASYNNVGNCLEQQGKYTEALPLYRKALTVNRNVLGEEHPHTALCYNNVASCLHLQGKHAEALPFYRHALDITRKALGEEHHNTALSYNNLARCLDSQARHAEALPLYHRALAICRQLFGEQHPHTATCYNNLALCLDNQGKYAEALPLFRKALATCRGVLGEQHPSTVQSYNNVASCLDSQGKLAEALPLHQKALALRRKALGEQHPHTAQSYNNLALCLDSQGKHAEALPLHRKALAIRLQVLGEQHPDTASSSNNVAFCLQYQGKHAEALPLYQKALVIRRKVLGEQHPETAHSYSNVASCLIRAGKYAEARSLQEKAVALCRKALGEQHPDTATCCNNLALCLDKQGKHAEALPLFQRTLTVRRKVLGEQHPDTAQSYNNVALCLDSQGQHAEASRYWEKALLGHECGRIQAAASGFDRALFRAGHLSPRGALSACLVRLGKPVEAWQHAEADLARGLLDDLLPSAETTADADRRARISKLDQTLLSLLSLEKPDEEQVKRREALAKERDSLLVELAANAARRIRERVLSLPRIQKQLASDAALIFWLDVSGEHLGCVLRRQGPPVWVRLPGSGQDNAWDQDDQSLPGRVLAILADGRGDARARQRLLAQLHRQRLAPLEPHLKNVRLLLVVPAGAMAAVPVEVLTDRYTVSYVPSASVFARQAEQHRPLQATSLLVLADPLFRRTAPVLPAAPPHGLLILAVTPGGLAARIGLHPGDVLLEYNGKKLTAATNFTPAAEKDRVPLKLWRDGKTLAGRIPTGKLGVAVDKRPVAEALAAWRKQESDLLTLGRGDNWQPLPGTRLEARTLAALVPRTTTLLGSNASQQKLAELATTDRLKAFRLLHLATHGQANPVRPELTALILAQDHLPDANATAQAVLAGKKPVDGRLTVATILADWHLDADLVVLSACQTGLGKDSGGEGMLGFTQALLQKGARSVLLSRWKVDDAATALLMARFYENLLGSRKGSKTLGRAAALVEAKGWLRQLSRAQATEHLAALVDGVPRGERGSIKAALPTRKTDAPKGADRPFAAPYYWAAFVLLGDPQ